MAYTLNRRLAQLIDSNGQLLTGKIPNDYITSDHVADNTITAAMLHTSFTVSASNLGTTLTPTFSNITTTGYIAGPATFTIDPAAVGDNTGTVVIAGNLQVDGTTTTINSTTMEVDDLNITLASGAANAAAANGAGITVDGASATITYDGTNDQWDFNKDISISGNAEIVRSAPVLDLMEDGVTDSNHRLRQNAGNLYIQKLSDDKGTSTDRIVLDGGTGNVGIGTSTPDAKLNIAHSSDNLLTIQNNTYQGSGQNTEVALRFKATSSSDDERAKAGILLKNDGSAFGRGDLHFLVDSNDDNGNAVLADSKMVISHEGNVGIGCTPDAWSGYSVLQIGTAGCLAASEDTTFVGANAYSSASGWKYVTTDEASLYQQESGNHIWYGAASGSADAAISWSERMRIDSAGNVAIGHTTTTGSKFAICDGANSQIQFFPEISTDTNLTQHYDPTAAAYINAETRAASHSWKIGTSEAMSINSSGNVNIGGNGLPYKLGIFVSNSGTAQNAFTTTNNANADYLIKHSTDLTITGTSSGALAINTAGTERMRINSTGEVHITSGGAPITPSIKYGGATGDFAKLRLINRSGQGANKGGVLELGAITDDSVTRSDVFAALHGGKDNSISANRAGYMDFHTSNGSSLDQRMRLTSNGELLMGDTTLRGSTQRGQIQVTQISNSNAAGISCISGNDEIAGTFCLYSSGTASAMISVDPDQNRAYSNFYIHIDGAQKAILDSGGNFSITGSYGNSDRALKENIVTLPSQLETVKQLNPVSFDWKERAEDGSTESSIGFIAQEVEALYPNLIRTPVADSDAEEADTTQYKSLNYAVMVSILTKAIQEQQTIIDNLKSRIETLEG